MKDLRADMKGVVSALHGKAGKYVDDVREAIHESVHPHGKREGENMSRDYDKAVLDIVQS